MLPDVVGTSCGQRLEPVEGTNHTDIIRLPFRSKEGGVLRKWISRFDVWPYLETFAEDCIEEVVKQMQAKPDLIIGNYSDGNLVASLMAHKLEVTQVYLFFILCCKFYPNVIN